MQGAFPGARYVAGRHAGFELLIYLVPVLPVALILLAAASRAAAQPYPEPLSACFGNLDGLYRARFFVLDQRHHGPFAAWFFFSISSNCCASGGKEAATFPRMLELALLKLPAMAEILLPFAVLFGGMLAFSA